MNYKNKETGEIEKLKDIKFGFNELIYNSIEFEEYINNFDKYLKDFYIIYEGGIN